MYISMIFFKLALNVAIKKKKKTIESYFTFITNLICINIEWIRKIIFLFVKISHYIYKLIVFWLNNWKSLKKLTNVSFYISFKQTNFEEHQFCRLHSSYAKISSSSDRYLSRSGHEWQTESISRLLFCGTQSRLTSLSITLVFIHSLWPFYSFFYFSHFTVLPIQMSPS